MMVIAKLLLVILVLWAGSSSVTSTMYHHNTMRKFEGKFVCDKYRLPRNAVWTPRTNCEGSKRFKCQPGYESRVQTRCENGVVSLEPTCHGPALVKCLSGEKIAYSENVTQLGMVGEDFEFSCKSEFTAKGTTGVLTCGENGNWTIKEPCKGPAPVTCLSGEKIPYSKNVTQSGMVGEDFEFSCQSEFTENGTTGVLTCDENGNWAIKEPCKVCYMPGRMIEPSVVIGYGNRLNQADCNNLCDQIDGCNYSRLVQRFNLQCLSFKKPISFVSSDLSNSQCIEKCKELAECLTITYNYDGCFIFNTTFEIMKERIEDGPDRFFIREKRCFE